MMCDGHVDYDGVGGGYSNVANERGDEDGDASGVYGAYGGDDDVVNGGVGDGDDCDGGGLR